ncbi:MAG: hypothetical protein HY558_02415, partial [Euryarchaeota archaeon]|nr:hypothetical protein [Euryarchaeota archaeon]
MGTEAATTRPEVEPDRQTLLFFWTLGLSMLVALLGLLFDGVWHSLRQFEEFWSPPHLMIYTGFGVGGASLLIALLTPRLRENPALGPGFKVPPLAVPVPASLFLIGLGSIQAVAAGFVDSAWHAQLGINETTWAYPHMMVVLGGVLMSMGLMTGFSGLRVPRGRPAWPVVMFCAGLLIIFAFPLAPLAQTPEAIQRQIANADFYRLDAQNIRVQHAFLQQGIHAGHPLLVPLLWPLALMA